MAKIRLFDAEKRSLSGSQAPDIIFSPVLPGFFPLLPDVLSVAERWTFFKRSCALYGCWPEMLDSSVKASWYDSRALSPMLAIVL